jgi:SAM-dependent methyltransferase
MNPSAADLCRYAWQMLNGFRVNLELSLANMRRQDMEPYLGSSRCLRVLDLANGRLRPQYLLLSASGHRAYGIDLANRPERGWLDLAYRGARHLYRWKLGLPALNDIDLALVCGRVNALPFQSNYFDLVTCVAAFEHFLDVPAVVAEVHRVLRLSGLAWILIHLFSSPSGGHNLGWTEIPRRNIPKGVDPWDHLRKRRLPFTVPLNEWRLGQYLTAFSRHFEILKSYCAIREGEGWLTAEITAELSDYSWEELTCGAYVIVARKQ